MPFVLKEPRGESKGIVVLTHKDGMVLEGADRKTRRSIERLRERYVVAMHWGHFMAEVGEIPWVDVHLAAPGTLSFARGVTARRIPLSSRDFTPAVFSDRGLERYWDVISIARPITVKNLDQLLRAIRLARDTGARIKALLLCPRPDEMPVKEGWYASIYSDYLELFAPEDREDVTLLMLRERYPFPVGVEFISHLYNQSKALALFSDREGESRVVAEALLCGCWVLAKRAVKGGAGDYLSAGNSLRFDTVEEAGHALRVIHERTETTAVSARHVEDLCETFTAPRLRRELEAIFAELGLPCEGEWHLGNLARELPAHVLTLPRRLRRSVTNDLRDARAARAWVDWLLGASAA